MTPPRHTVRMKATPMTFPLAFSARRAKFTIAAIVRDKRVPSRSGLTIEDMLATNKVEDNEEEADCKALQAAYSC